MDNFMLRNLTLKWKIPWKIKLLKTNTRRNRKKINRRTFIKVDR